MIKPLKNPPLHVPQKKQWQLQTAKARFSELFNIVRTEGPQWVSRRGKESVVILSAEEFERLRTLKTGHQNVAEFFAKSPLAASGIDLDREKDHGREISL